MLLVLLSGFCSPGRWELLVLSRGLSFCHVASLFDFLADFALEARPVHSNLLFLTLRQLINSSMCEQVLCVRAFTGCMCVRKGGDAFMAVSDLSTSQFDRARREREIER